MKKNEEGERKAGNTEMGERWRERRKDRERMM